MVFLLQVTMAFCALVVLSWHSNSGQCKGYHLQVPFLSLSRCRGRIISQEEKPWLRAQKGLPPAPQGTEHIVVLTEKRYWKSGWDAPSQTVPQWAAQSEAGRVCPLPYMYAHMETVNPPEVPISPLMQQPVQKGSFFPFYSTSCGWATLSPHTDTRPVYLPIFFKQRKVQKQTGIDLLKGKTKVMRRLLLSNPQKKRAKTRKRK